MAEDSPNSQKDQNNLSTLNISGLPTRWQRFRYHPWIFYPTVIITGLAAIVAIVAGLITAGADVGGAKRQLQEWGLIRAFRPASEDEILIVIASFYHSEGVTDT